MPGPWAHSFLRDEISGGGQEEDDCGDEQRDERVDDAVGCGAVAEVVCAHARLHGEARHLLRDALVQFGAALVRHGCKAGGTECTAPNYRGHTVFAQCILKGQK